jgi:hypothetical protein
MNYTEIIVSLISLATAVMVARIQKTTKTTAQSYQQFLIMLWEMIDAEGSLSLATLEAMEKCPQSKANGKCEDAKKTVIALKKDNKAWMREHIINDITGGQ